MRPNPLFRLAFALSACVACASSAGAATGGLTCTVRDGLTSTGLYQATGSWCDDYGEYSLQLHRVSTSFIFTDSDVSTTMPGGGYTVTGYATDYVPKTVTNVQIYAGSTTTVNFPLYRPVLALTLSPGSIAENGGAATATITLKDGAGNVVALRNDLTLTAASGNAKATVTQPATIPAGSSTGTFTVTGVDDALIDADTVVTITVSAAWGSGYADVTVVNDDH
jgi:hypothetical protein